MKLDDVEAKGRAYQLGFQTAEYLFYQDENRTEWINPFPQQTEAWKGFEEAVYILTQK